MLHLTSSVSHKLQLSKVSAAVTACGASYAAHGRKSCETVLFARIPSFPPTTRAKGVVEIVQPSELRAHTCKGYTPRGLRIAVAGTQICSIVSGYSSIRCECGSVYCVEIEKIPQNRKLPSSMCLTRAFTRLLGLVLSISSLGGAWGMLGFRRLWAAVTTFVMYHVSSSRLRSSAWHWVSSVPFASALCVKVAFPVGTFFVQVQLETGFNSFHHSLARSSVGKVEDSNGIPLYVQKPKVRTETEESQHASRGGQSGWT
eukprot:6476829-Amphidinium_carterae.1